MELVTRGDLPGLLALFDMDYGDAGLEAALRATGIKPTRFLGVSGGRGRVSLYDPMVAWVIASVWESNKRRFGDLKRELERFRRLYDEVVDRPESARIPGFTESRELGAQLLMLTSPLRGFEPRDIRRIARRHPEVLDLSAFGRDYLVNVLQAYNDVYGETIASLSIDPRDDKPRSVDQQISDFAHQWLHVAANRFLADEYNASEEAHR